MGWEKIAKTYGVNPTTVMRSELWLKKLQGFSERRITLALAFTISSKSC